MKLNKALLAAITLVSGISNASAAVSLITDGNFESIAAYGTGTGATFRTVGPNDPFITGWSVGDTSVDVIRNGYGAISGNSIDLLGTPGPGSIQQSFSALANMTYELDFDLFRNGSTGIANVTFGGVTTRFVADTFTAARRISLFFTAATDGPSLLKFESNNVVANSGAVIDNVSVTAVPEPETYALLLTGLGFVAFMARRRQQQRQADNFSAA